jgi:hypothetical protein
MLIDPGSHSRWRSPGLGWANRRSGVALDALTKTDAKVPLQYGCCHRIKLIYASCISIGHPSQDALRGVTD